MCLASERINARIGTAITSVAVQKLVVGATQLSDVWTDPDFNPSQHAVYYLRVIEIPTPRWTTFPSLGG